MVSLAVIVMFLTGFVNASSLDFFSIGEDSVIYVDDDNTDGPWDGTIEHPYQYIQDAIDNASNCDTVFVFNGTYDEYVNLNKTINLIGEDRNNTIIDEHVKIASDWVNITGFTIQNSSWGLTGIAVWSNYNSIIQNTIMNNGDGIWLDDWLGGASNNIISGNTITDNLRCGIKLTGSSNNILGNTITDNWFAGIDIGFGSYSYNNNISGNTIIDNEYGINLWGDDDTSIYRNIICNNNEVGIYLRWSDFTIIRRNTIMNNKDEGIILDTSSNNIISGNILTNNKNGISITDNSDNNTIDTNTISDQYYGIWMVISSDNNSISDNKFIKNNCGLYQSGSAKNNIKSNNFRKNKLNAFFINCNQILWEGNYWNRPRLLPKPIFGLERINRGLWIPCINYDNHPARKPYDI